MSAVSLTERGRLVFDVMASELGAIAVVLTERGLAHVELDLADPERFEARLSELAPEAERARDPVATKPVTDALLRYAAADVQSKTFSDARRHAIDEALRAIPLDLGGTAFQREVWVALRSIPFGETRTYADIARAIGRPTAARAVGGANHDNPAPIFVPCHRVVASDGLGGFAAGVGVKERLLAHEGVLPPSLFGPLL